jgi:hypothetical protein
MHFAALNPAQDLLADLAADLDDVHSILIPGGTSQLLDEVAMLHPGATIHWIPTDLSTAFITSDSVVVHNDVSDIAINQGSIDLTVLEATGDRDRADRAVARLSRLLEVDRAWLVINPWFGDLRAFRRGVVIRVLREHGVPHALSEQVIGQLRSTQDRNLLKLISLNPHVAALLKEQDIASILAVPENDRSFGPIKVPDGVVGPIVMKDSDTRCWKMRAIEALLIGGHVPSDALAFERPMEFVWAVGRQAHEASLPLLRRVLEEYKSDPEFVWRCTRAFERMGEPEDIAHIRTLAEAIVREAAMS